MAKAWISGQLVPKVSVIVQYCDDRLPHFHNYSATVKGLCDTDSHKSVAICGIRDIAGRVGFCYVKITSLNETALFHKTLVLAHWSCRLGRW